jgi:hypothetical protein
LIPQQTDLIVWVFFGKKLIPDAVQVEGRLVGAKREVLIITNDVVPNIVTSYVTIFGYAAQIYQPIE